MIKYRAFIKVAESGSISQAAKELGYSQPGVTHMIDALEAEIGVPLLIRSKRSIRITDDGVCILDHCRKILNEYDNMIESSESLRGLSSGVIKIASLSSMMVSLVPEIVDKYANAYPNIKIYLHEMLTTQEMHDALTGGKVDIAFMTGEVPHGFQFVHLIDDPLCIAVNKVHPYAVMDKIPAASLNNSNLIMPTPGWNDMVEQIHSIHGNNNHTKYYVGSDTAGLSMVERNFGLYVISALQKPLLPNNVTAKELKENYYRPLGYCIRTLNNMRPSVSEFVKLTNTHFSQLDHNIYPIAGSRENGIAVY